MKPFVWDAETSARADAAAFVEEPVAPANYRDVSKIEAYLAEKRAAQIERAALSAETARILCIGILRDDCAPLFIGDDDEKVLLTRTWDELGSYAEDEQFCTFNGNRFDWPMLMRRSYALNVRIPGWCPLDMRWRNSRHVDLLELWSCGDRTASISLDRLARLCGLPGKDSNGGDFARKWVEDREAALKYLTTDLELTRALWQRMR